MYVWLDVLCIYRPVPSLLYLILAYQTDKHSKYLECHCNPREALCEYVCVVQILFVVRLQ